MIRVSETFVAINNIFREAQTLEHLTAVVEGSSRVRPSAEKVIRMYPAANGYKPSGTGLRQRKERIGLYLSYAIAKDTVRS